MNHHMLDFFNYKEQRTKQLGKFKKILQLSNDHMKAYERELIRRITDENNREDFKFKANQEFGNDYVVEVRGTSTIEIASKHNQIPLLTVMDQEDGTFSISSSSGMIREWDEFEFKAHHIKELSEFLEKVLFDKEHMTDYLEEDNHDD